MKTLSYIYPAKVANLGYKVSNNLHSLSYHQFLPLNILHLNYLKCKLNEIKLTAIANFGKLIALTT
jgi:hypothetical protein